MEKGLWGVSNGNDEIRVTGEPGRFDILFKEREVAVSRDDGMLHSKDKDNAAVSYRLHFKHTEAFFVRGEGCYFFAGAALQKKKCKEKTR